ncbi:TauD/TfdA family dioxygenase [Actinoplanes sp. NPDC051470]|uniref:TauD/TfdA family dioxygenase n=1 Tax=Actinoplanes sp. NPDC051470 TaxID=3157224 RepID=UPI0034299478
MDTVEVSAKLMKDPEMLTTGHPDVVVCDAEESAEIMRIATDLTSAHKARLDAAEVDRRFDDPLFLVSAETAARRISPALVHRIVDFRVSGSTSGVLAVRGLPVDRPLPDTPGSGAHHGPWQELAVSSAVQLMVMSLLGEVIAYADEKRGRLIQDVCPVPGAEQRQENTGSTLLELHTEDGFHPHKPDFLSLFCLRGDQEGRALTVAGGVRAVLPALPARHREALRRAAFHIRLSSSFAGTGPARYCAPLPVLSGPVEDPELCIDLHAMEALDDEGAAALRALSRLLLSRLTAISLSPGDLLVVDNRLAVHGRTGFEPRYDGADRWLRRCYAVSDLRPSANSRPPRSRVHHPL